MRIEKDASKVTITASKNGPYLVKGPVTIRDAEGTEYQVERATVALCRCGGSTNKPFCDGTHSKIGFQAAERAVEREDGRRISLTEESTSSR